MTKTLHRVLAVTGASVLALVLGACATEGGGPSPSGAQTPSGGDDRAVAAAWLDSGRALGIVTWGSSTCVPFADEPIFADGVLTVEIGDIEGQACTRDHVARGTFVPLPEGVDAANDLSVVVTGSHHGDARLAGDSALLSDGRGGGYLPSAGWFDADGFVLLSWGSSGCVPQLERVEATGAAEVTATFVTPSPDQVCTADMAPRLTVGAVTGVKAETGVQLVLVGDVFDNLRLPIAGSR